MDLIYADKSRIEQGVIQNFDVDYDTAGNKDFQITVGIKNNVLQGGFWWYIEGTEYGGRIDAYKVITEEDEIQYTGKNFRGILTTKIIEPPTGQDYKISSGTIQSIVEELIGDAGFEELFVVDECDVAVSSYQFNRYISTYEGICSLAKRFSLVPAFMVQDGIVHISFGTATDYSDDNEYTQDDLNFTIKRSFSDVNHLICLGQGELKDRTVVHLYADADGNISETQSLFDIDEVVEIYENVNAEDAATLKAEGIERLNELKNTDSFEVTIPDIALKIGDIIGGVERVTNTYVAREIVNIIAKISDSRIDLEYKVGEDDVTPSRTSGGESSGTSSGGGGGGVTYELPPATVDALGGVIVGNGLTIEADGTVSVTNEFTSAEKTKLSGIATGANKTVVDSALSTTSTNPVQNKVVQAALAGKADATHFHTIDTALSSTSTNPVQNKVVYAALAGKANVHSHNYLPLSGGTVTGNLTVNGTLNNKDCYSTTVSNSANVYINTSYNYRRSSSSSKRYKHDIMSELKDELNPEMLYDLEVVQYKYNADYLAEDDIRYMKDVIGFIAEDVLEKYPIAANYSIDEETGETTVEDWDARYVIPALLKLIQNQKKDLDEKEKRINDLENRLNTLEERMNELCK